METVLDIDRLTLEFPIYGGAIRALDAVSIKVGAGEIVGVVGESGCGKSVTVMTALRLVPEGSYRVTDGSITLLGVDAVRATERELGALRGAKASMIFQEPLTALNPTRRVGDQMVEMIRAHQRLSAAKGRTLAERLLDAMRIADPGEVLGPLRAVRRHAPARGDRAGLRERSRHRHRGRADDGARRDGAAAGVVPAARPVARRRRGRAPHHARHGRRLGIHRPSLCHVCRQVVESGPTRAVLDTPIHPCTRALLAASPDEAPAKSLLASIPGGVPDLRHPPAGCGFAARCPYEMPRCADRPPDVEVPSTAGPRRALCWLPAMEDGR